MYIRSLRFDVYDMKRSPEELYRERMGRFEDALQLKVPDRVPIFWSDGGSYFAAKYVGMIIQEAFYDAKKWFMANKKVIMDFEPDIYFRPHFNSGRILEILDHKTAKWPGHGVAPDETIQYGNQDNMNADEYNAFLDDPSDYTMRTFLPRVYRALEPLKDLFPLRLFSLGEEPTKLTQTFAKPEIVTAINALIEAGKVSKKWVAASEAFEKEMRELGFPEYRGIIVMAPFDHISSPLRGMRGVMLDMYRQPEKLLEAIERVTPWLIEKTIAEAKESGNPTAYVGLYWGADGYMSLKHFENFYWPGLKKLISGLLDAGLTLIVSFDGPYNSKLEYIAELPKGKIVCFFDSMTDISKAKEILGDKLCIGGNLPASMLQVGTPQQIKKYSKKLIDVGGEGGGFVMTTQTISEEANPELVKVYIDFIKEYGIYKR